jgi:cell division protein FtsB
VQRYARGINSVGGDSTVEDDVLAPNSNASDVPALESPKIPKGRSNGRRRRGKGTAQRLSEHISLHFPGYLIAVLSALVSIVLAVGIVWIVEQAKISAQLDTQKQSTDKDENRITQLEKQISDLATRIAEQSITIQFLEKQSQKTP